MSRHESADRSLVTALRLLGVLVFCGLVAGLVYSAADPRVPLLVDSGDAAWITARRDFGLRSRFEPETNWRFRRRFSIDQPLAGGSGRCRALRTCRLLLDGRLLWESPQDSSRWRETGQVALPPMNAGEHELTVAVHNQNGPAALWMDSNLEQLRSGERWEVSTTDGQTWGPAWPAGKTKSATISSRFPTTIEALRCVFPWLLAAFLGAFAVTFHSSAGPRCGETAQIPLTARHLKTLLMLLWVALAAHNIRRVPWYVGYDVQAHLDYIRYVAQRGELPAADDG